MRHRKALLRGKRLETPSQCESVRKRSRLGTCSARAPFLERSQFLIRQMMRNSDVGR